MTITHLPNQYDRDEDGIYDDERILVCDQCNDDVPQSEAVAIDDRFDHQVLCPKCVARNKAEAEYGPECTCRQTAVDLFDARGCEAHDLRMQPQRESRIRFEEVG